MAEPTQAEVIPKSIITEGAPLAGRAAEYGDAIKAALNKDGFRAGLRVESRKPIDGGKIAEKAAQIGIERDPATGQKVLSPEDQERKDNFEKFSKRAQTFLENPSSLPASERNTIKKKILDKMNQSPAFANETRGLSTADRTALLERYLNNPAYAEKVREVLEEQVSADNKLVDEEAINIANDNVSETQYERDLKEQEFTDAKNRLQNIDDKLKDFDTGEAKALEIDSLAAEIPALSAELSDLGKKIKDIDYSLPRLERELAALMAGGNPITPGRDSAFVDGEITKITKARSDAQERKTEIEGKQAKLEALKLQEKELQERRKDASKEKIDRELEFRKLEHELTKRKRALEDLKSSREAQEQNMVDGMENVFSEAAGKLIDEQVEAALSAFDKEAERLKTESVDQNEQALYDALRERWLGPERRSRGLFGFGRERRYRPINRNQVNTDTDILLREGPPALMRQLLMSRINPATGVNYTPDEAQALANNSAFRDKMQPEMIEQVLARRALVGRMNPEDIQIVVNSPWGPGMIERGLSKNQEARQIAEKLLGENALEGHGFVGRVMNEFSRNPALFALLLGIPAIVGALNRTSAGVEVT